MAAGEVRTLAETWPIVGIPHIGDIRPYFFDTYIHLNRPPQTAVIRVADKPIDLARNMIVEAALDDERMTHLFFMDSDMQFPRDALVRLIQQDKPVIGGIYFARTTTPIPHAYHFHHRDNEDGTCPIGDGYQHASTDRGTWYRPVVKEFAAFMKRHPDYDEQPGIAVLPATPDALVPCDALATGCMLIKREVLEAIRDAHPGDKRPWFKCHEDSAGGEDFYFCEQARALGYDIWADFSVQCSHEFRPLFMERVDFKRRFKIGEADEYDFDQDLIVDASPGRPAETMPVQQSEAG